MSKSNAFETALLLLLFNNDDIANVGDGAGIQGSAVAGDLYLSLHTADPGEAGDQTTSETTYTGYAREPVARSTSGWTVTGNSVSPVDPVAFGTNTAGTGTITHAAIGLLSSGAGMILYSGALTPNITLSVGIAPQIEDTSTITED